jgi:PTS system mannose-specific IIB component/fructoselysine and glucoselysine-specific PTS system IIB component
MPIVLYRVDERLIHGQVVVGWGGKLHPERIVVVDDALAASSWEQDLYSLGLPDNVTATFATVAEARDHLAEWRRSAARMVLLTRDLDSMRRLADGGTLTGEEINIGGIHYAPGRQAVLPYIYLSEGERGEMAELAAQGAIVSARDLPGGRRVSVDQLLQRNADGR